MNRQNVLLIFGAAWISAALLTWLLYATTQTPRVEKSVAVVAAARDMPAGTLLRKSDLRIVHMRQGDAPKASILEEKLALDRPLLFPVTANEPLTATRIASAKGIEGLASTIEVGMRAISVPINDSSGVSGLIQPRAHVDVLFTKAGQTSDTLTTTILEDVVVLAIGRTTEAASSATTPAAAQAAALRPTAQSATLLATPEQAQVIELAKNLGKVSLALRNPLDDTAMENETGTVPDDIFPGLGRKPVPPRQEPPPAPKPVVKPAPAPVREKAEPKKVVEVFRGTQHVQEIFK